MKKLIDLLYSDKNRNSTGKKQGNRYNAQDTRRETRQEMYKTEDQRQIKIHNVQDMQRQEIR